VFLLAQYIPDLRLQYLKIKGFGQVVSGAGFQSFQLLVLAYQGS
jgi:hypothetical protein